MEINFKLPALSIQQPWAWLIINGYKSIENRTWGTKRRGAFLVHAGKAFDRFGYQWVKASFPHIKMPDEKDFDRGGIVGIASIIACVEPRDSSLLTSRDAPWYNPECHAFVLEDVKSIPFIPCKGMLGFFIPKLEVQNG